MNSGIKIFFTGSIRGGRADQPQYADILEILKQLGTVLSGPIADEALSDYGETDITNEEIHNRELEALTKSDLVVAEVTTPSLGVGYIIKEATTLNKKIIALYNGDDTLKLSAMIKGNKNIKVFAYKTPEDLENIFASLE